jgi:hypothetical protein
MREVRMRKMKLCLYLGIILGLLASFLIVAVPASAATYTVEVENITVYQDSTGQTTNIVVTDIPAAGLGGGSFTLTPTAGITNIRITDVQAGVGFMIVSKTITAGGVATGSVVWTDFTVPPPANGSAVLATLVFDVVGGAGSETVTPSGVSLYDANGAPATAGTLTNGTVTILTVKAACITTWVPTLNAGKAGIKINIGKGTGGDGVVYPSSYKATSAYTPAALAVVGVTALSAWMASQDPTTIPGSFVFTGSRTPGAEGDAAFFSISLVGQAGVQTTLTPTWNILRGDCGSGFAGLIPGGIAPLNFVRGDIDGTGTVNLGDIIVGKRYLVGLSVAATFNPVNFASIMHDGSAGDEITPLDVYRLTQYLGGFTDAYFNLL